MPVDTTAPEVVDVDEPVTITTTDVDVDASEPEVDSDVQDTSALDVVSELETRLAVDRRKGAVNARHKVAVRRGRLSQARELAELDDAEAAFDAELERRKRDREARIELESLRRETASGGHRARIRTMVLRSAEYRALRVESVRTWGMRVGIGALLVMAAWSTSGVHEGMARLLGMRAGDVGWWAAWLMEPALMVVVAMIIMIRSKLSSSGGALPKSADRVEYGLLVTSIALNLAGGGSPDVQGWALVGMYAAHSIGPVGAAGIAWLLGTIDAACTSADPWTGAPTMAELGLIEDSAPQSTSQNAIHVAAEQPKQDTPINQRKQLTGLSPADRAILDAARAAITRGELTTPVTATSVYRDVMGRRGDKGRATRVAALLAA